MKSTGILLSTCAALLFCGEVHAQARGPSVAALQDSVAQPALSGPEKLAALDTWLRRLAGRYRITRMGRAAGMEDCIGIGAGPGVQCVIGPPPPNPDGTAPTMVLYGVDPDVPGIRYLQVNGRSIAEGDLGKLSDDTLGFSKVQCPTTLNRQSGSSMLSCQRQVRIYAPPGSTDVLIQTHTEQRIIPPSRPGARHQQLGSQLIEFTDDLRLQRIPAQ